MYITIIMKESTMHYLILKVLNDPEFKYENGRKMLDAWMKAKKIFEQMTEEEKADLEKNIADL